MDNAFERARAAYGTGAYDDATLEFLFPQLKESEDEKIMKDIVAAVEMYGDFTQSRKEEIYAYIEKQKEQKPDDDPLNDPKFLKGFDTGREVQRIFDEKKPAEWETLGKPMTHKEWAEDYWEHHKFASPNGNDKCDVIQFGHKGFIDFCIAYCVDQKPQDRLVLHDTFGYEKGRQVGQREGVGMVLKTPESYGLYKPAEWSEEDEDAIAAIDVALDTSKAISKDVYARTKTWLKSLRPSWKPSEQEKSALRTAIYVLTEERCFPKTAAQLQNILDAFNGEESSKDWKPSEEQMKHLERCFTHGHTVGLPNQHVLESLYQDLKKLM